MLSYADDAGGGSLHVSLVLDACGSDDVAFRAVTASAAAQLAELLALRHLQAAPDPTAALLVSVTLARGWSREERLRAAPAHTPAGLASALRCLRELSGPAAPRMQRAPPDADAASLLAAAAAAAQSPPTRAAAVCVTTRLPHGALFAAAVEACAALPEGQRVAVVCADAAAACVTATAAGEGGSLARTPPDPEGVREALQAALADALLPGGRAVPCVLALGEAEVRCHARRPYLAELRRCTQSEDVLEAARARPPALLQRGRVRRTGGGGPEGGGPATLRLRAVVEAHRLDDARLGGGPWELTAPRGRPEAELAAVFERFGDCMMLLECDSRCLDDGCAWPLPGRRVFAAFFAERTRVVMRRVTPSELRRPALPRPRPPRLPDAAAFDAQLARAREEAVERSRDPSFSLDALLAGGVVEAAAQTSTDDRLRVCLSGGGTTRYSY